MDRRREQVATRIRRLLDCSGLIALACAALVLAGALWFEPPWLRALLLRGLFLSVTLSVALFGVARVLEIGLALRGWHRRASAAAARRSELSAVPSGSTAAGALKDEPRIDDAA